ncbi:MAG: 23S rRNA (uracil(1939)-C(5))-methyltransferase RlmD [Lachnospiraceae bacterium]|nr:23S rRNA (uracil(1939)-C(5))-methyltransferase RlmD [Lachnospiraceae bacterium]
MLKKNDILDVTIEDMGSEGEGVAKADGYALFIKDALKGDKVRVKVMKMSKNYGYARVEEILEPSPDRVKPVCKEARRCGGCQIQEMSYDAQLLFKQNKVKNNLIRIGKLNDVEVFPTIGMDNPYNYRNKAQFPVGTDKDGNIVMGFYAGRTHSIIPCDDCAIGVAENKEILEIIKEYMVKNNVKPYDEVSGTGLVRHILIRKGFKTGEIMVCIIINGDRLTATEELVSKLLLVSGMTSISYNINKEKTNRILGEKVINLYGEGYITDYIGDVKFKISPLSFYQVNPVQTEKLYGKALEYAGLTGDETVWDLYCGVGTISLFLAKNAKKVYGVEIVPAAIEDAKENAHINAIENSEFFVGKAEEVFPEHYKKYGEKADVIVVDPPRKGCDEALLKTIVEMAPKRLVYVSCDSATLARDLKILVENGFTVEKVQPVDMFPHSGHVETVACLQRVDM